jgi:hypothetical protein
MQTETLWLTNMGIEDFKDAFNKMQQDPQSGQVVALYKISRCHFWPDFSGRLTVTELFEGVRAITYQIREKKN